MTPYTYALRHWTVVQSRQDCRSLPW